MTDQELNAVMQQIGVTATNSAHELANASGARKDKALMAMADAIEAQVDAIIAANAKDIKSAQSKDYPAAFIDRLQLSEAGVFAMANGLRAIAKMPDPVGRELARWQQPNDLDIARVSVPLGVIAVIYESRPNVTADAAGLCLKAGNAVILRGGSESFHSAQAIMQCIHTGLGAAELPTGVVQMVPTTDRNAVGILLSMDKYIDVIVPRGGKSLISRITDESKIPLFKHLEGICHTYVHQDADLAMAKEIILNAKMRRTGICGATETVLIDESIVSTHAGPIVKDLLAAGCEVRGDVAIAACDERVQVATDEDWETEYLDAIISIRAVPNLQAAIEHINTHGSQHTDAIITQNLEAATEFLNAVDSAIVMHNTSTQFADGGEFGMGAEIGISTGKLHARGPVGVEQLTTFKYQVRGQGQVRPS